jgi:EmrB/QacA subfamily drug resistance transporter
MSTAGKKTGWIMAATISGGMMTAINGTAVNVVLPVIQTDLNATMSQAQWIYEAYVLFLASLLLTGGSLGDRFGRRRMYALGVILYSFSAFVCGLAQTMGQIISARIIQGIGGALLLPGCLSIISSHFSKERHGKAIGIWTGITSIGAAIGPVVGGVLTDKASWRWVFFINLPIAVLTLVILFLRVPESTSETGGERRRIDIVGALLITTGMASVIFGLVESTNAGFLVPRILITLVTGTVLVVLFLVVEKRVKNPLLPMNLFRARNFSGANLLSLLVYAALGSVLFFFPFNLIQIQNYSATAAGAALLPFVVVMFALSRWTGGLVHRFGPRLPLVIGTLVTGCGYVAAVIPKVGGSYWTTFFPAILLLGIGMSFCVAPITTTVIEAAGARFSGLASGFNTAVARVAALVSIAVIGIAVIHIFQKDLDTRLVELDLEPAVLQTLRHQESKLAAIEIPDNVEIQKKKSIENAIAIAFVKGFRILLVICIGLSFSGTLAALFMIHGRGVHKLQ